MAALPQVIRDEHKELAARTELLRTVADSIGSAAIETLREEVGQVCIFLIHQLILMPRPRSKSYTPQLEDSCVQWRQPTQ